jgi:hypothetical protein
VFHYNLSFYYFVAKNNTGLAVLLEKPLMIALADDSLIKSSKHLFPLEQWKDKRYFELSNEALGSELSLENKQFWLNLKAQ